MTQHSFNRKVPATAYMYCGRCGLIRLNNSASRRQANKPCDTVEVPQAPKWLREK